MYRGINANIVDRLQEIVTSHSVSDDQRQQHDEYASSSDANTNDLDRRDRVVFQNLRSFTCLA
jgi:hypothetical protein